MLMNILLGKTQLQPCKVGPNRKINMFNATFNKTKSF